MHFILSFYTIQPPVARDETIGASPCKRKKKTSAAYSPSICPWKQDCFHVKVNENSPANAFLF